MLATWGLLGVAAFWGLSFPLTKVVLEETSPIDFLAVRFTLAALVTGAVLWRYARRLTRTMVIRGLLLGALYGVAQIVQTEGLARTSASVSGFITGMYVVLTPVCAVLLVRTRIRPIWWAGAVLATIGLAVMSLNGFSVGLGELLTLFSALLYAIHIVGLGQWSTNDNALGLSVVQLAACSLVTVPAAAFGGITLVHSPSAWLALAFLVVASGAGALIMQSWAQAHLPATRAAVIMVTEPVWAAGLSIGFFGEPLTVRIAIGGAVMLAAMLLVELAPRQHGDPPRSEDLVHLEI